ncbi:MAG: helix-turn-helix domain-containing protein [Bifidobacteriaceae bacterium]|nr:helix-turn-helix domain-containing protein [Bifidobacteriaceae bacterium]
MWAYRPSDWGRLARDRRVGLGLTQAQLAELAGVTRQWVNRFENGKGAGAARLDSALAVMDFLGLVVDVSPQSGEDAP